MPLEAVRFVALCNSEGLCCYAHASQATAAPDLPGLGITPLKQSLSLTALAL